MRTFFLVTATFALSVPAYSEFSNQWSECRKELRELISGNRVAVSARIENDALLYQVWLDEDWWDKLVPERRHQLAGMVRCSATEGQDNVEFTITVRGAFSNRPLVTYVNGTIDNGESR